MKSNISKTTQSHPEPKKPAKPAVKPAPANISQRYVEILRLRQRLSEAQAERSSR
ncbi:hypothetical protein ACFPFP_40145 [Bradyrhizobium sp. GCM10023182]|uniref:Transcriptional regulator n=1 Tax=Bradyrhizobium zhengyangense TaxID=2911009 RepID=A0ABS9M1H1_9BRAD|nr:MULTISPECIES: hypothetical protein [Bradyrhizobium]MCG2673098.1 hypothetical protein [Bradyrhizobium zhengyangense]